MHCIYDWDVIYGAVMKMYEFRSFMLGYPKKVIMKALRNSAKKRTEIDYDGCL